MSHAYVRHPHHPDVLVRMDADIIDAVPAAPWYVLGNDRMLSGWGPAEGLTVVTVCPCLDEEEASRVARNLRDDCHEEVREVTTPPRNHRGYLLRVVTSREGARLWYA